MRTILIKDIFMIVAHTTTPLASNIHQLVVELCQASLTTSQMWSVIKYDFLCQILLSHVPQEPQITFNSYFLDRIILTNIDKHLKVQQHKRNNR